MTDFNTAARPAYPADAPTTTARELANELSTFVASLRDAGQKLSAEIAQVKNATEEIQEEYNATAKAFVKNELPELNGDKFDELAELAQNTPEVGGQGLGFYRQKLLDARDGALRTLNQSLAETVDADGFQAALKNARGTFDIATAKKSTADDVVSTAETALASWEQSDEYRFVELNNEAQENGQPPLSADTAAYYAPSSVFTSAKNYLTKGEFYRKVWNVLADNGQGKNGKNILGEMAGYIKKTDDLTKAVTDAKVSYEAASDEARQARATTTTLSGAAKDIQTDDQILEQVQDKIVSYLAVPEFLKAVSTKYGEDFPHAIPLLSAKLVTLAQIEEGAEAKMQSLSANIAAVSEQYRKASNMRPRTTLNVDLDAIKQQNAARSRAYTNYAQATNQSWNRTASYTPPSTTVYVDNSPSFFEDLLLAEMLSNDNDDHYSHGYSNGFDQGPATSLAPYTADLLGADKSATDGSSALNTAFDNLDMKGPDDSTTPGPVFDFEQPSPLDQQLNDAFDTLQSSSSPDAAPSYNYNDDRSSYASSSSSSERYSSPSYGSGS